MLLCVVQESVTQLQLWGHVVVEGGSGLIALILSQRLVKPWAWDLGLANGT